MQGHCLSIFSIFRGKDLSGFQQDVLPRQVRLENLTGLPQLLRGYLSEAFGFRLSRISGSHHIFVHPDVPELVNLHDVGGQAKPYQIRQLLKLVERYSLQLGDE